jgi:hypothetical protein
MVPVDPPGNLYQKVWQLASKSGPAATGREIILMAPLGESAADGSGAASRKDTAPS